MRRHLPYLAAFVLATTSAMAAQTYRLEPVKLATAVYASLGFGWSSEKPDGARNLPSFESEQPQFSALPLGDKGDMLLAADLVTQGQQTRCTVYLDTNWNGSLAGEKPYPVETVETLEGALIAATAEIRLPVRYHIQGADDVVSEYRFRLSCGPGSEGAVGLPHTLCIEYGLSAMVDLGGERVRLTVYDATGDGKISPAQDDAGDMVILDKDPQGAPEPDEGLPLRPRMDYGNAFYEFRVRPDGREAAVEPYAGGLATLILEGTDGRGEPSHVTRFAAYSESYTTDRSETEGPQSLLPGHYEFAYIIGGGDPEKHAFVFSAPNGIDLTTGETLRVACGGPLSLHVSPTPGESEDGALTVTMDIAAETEAGHTFSESGREDAPGTVEVLDADGTVIAEGKAEYG